MSSASSSYIAAQKEWRFKLAEGQRKSSLAHIVSLDGFHKDGQYYITTVIAGANGADVKQKVVVGASFIKDFGKKKAKLLPDLVRIGATVMTKDASGSLSGSLKSRSYGGSHSYMTIEKACYNDLCAVFTEAEEDDWVSEGLL